MNKIAYVYARPDGTIEAVWDGVLNIPETIVARFSLDVAEYRNLFKRLADNTKAVRFENDALVIGAEVIADSAWIAARETEIVNAEQTANDTNSLRDFAALAQSHSKTIKALYLALVNADLNADNTATRFATLIGIIEDTQVTANAFKNRWNAAFTAESGVVVAGLDLVALLALSNANKQRYISFARYFTTLWAQMLLVSTIA